MAEQTREPALQRRSQALSHGYQRQCTMPRWGSIPVQVTAVRCLLPLYTFGCSCREAVGRLCCGSYQSPRAMRSRRWSFEKMAESWPAPFPPYIED
jgi:hypothetical protein